MPEILYWFEDLTPGREFPYAPVTITAEEIIAFASKFDPQPFHLSEEAGKASILGGLAASGWHTCSLLMRMFYDGLLQYAASEGGPGVDFNEWRKPVLAGDTLIGKTTVVESRVLKSRPTVGLVTLRHTVANQRGDTVLIMQNPAMIRLREGTLS